MGRPNTIDSSGESAAPAKAPPPARRRTKPAWQSAARHLQPLLWIGPALALIGFVVLLPVYIMFRTAFRNIDSIGFDHGYVEPRQPSSIDA